MDDKEIAEHQHKLIIDVIIGTNIILLILYLTDHFIEIGISFSKEACVQKKNNSCKT